MRGILNIEIEAVCVNLLGVVFFGEKISSGFGQTYPLFY
jgi:hypothetical protein